MFKKYKESFYESKTNRFKTNNKKGLCTISAFPNIDSYSNNKATYILFSDNNKNANSNSSFLPKKRITKSEFLLKEMETKSNSKHEYISKKKCLSHAGHFKSKSNTFHSTNTLTNKIKSKNLSINQSLFKETNQHFFSKKIHSNKSTYYSKKSINDLINNDGNKERIYKQNKLKLITNSSFQNKTKFNTIGDYNNQSINNDSKANENHCKSLRNILSIPSNLIDIYKREIIDKCLKYDYTAQSKNKKKLFVIVNGTVILNTNHIPGFMIEITLPSIVKQKMNEESRKKIFASFLKSCNEIINPKKPMRNVYSQQFDIIFDLCDLKDEDKYAFVSYGNIFEGISIPISVLFKYHTKSIQQKKEKRVFYEDKTKNNDIIVKNSKLENDSLKNFTRRKFKSIMTKKEDLNKSFCFNYKYESERENYFYYSENEERKKKLTNLSNSKEIKTLIDLFISFNNKKCKSKIYHCIFDQTKNVNLQKIILKNIPKTNASRMNDYIKQNHLNPLIQYCSPEKQLTTIANNDTDSKHNKLTQSEFLKGLLVIKQENPNIDLSNLYLKTSKEISEEKKRKLNNMTFNNEIRLNDKKVNKAYPHLLSFNIPKLESTLNLTRAEMYHFFTQFKSIINFWININDFGTTSLRGIDFESFIHFVPDVCNEIPVLAYEIFKQINKSQYGLITLVDYLKGMVNRTKHKDDEVDLFLKLLDPHKKQSFGYHQIREIFKLSIRNHMLKKSKVINNEIENLLSHELTKSLFEDAQKLLNEEISYVTIKTIINNHLKGYKYKSFFSF